MTIITTQITHFTTITAKHCTYNKNYNTKYIITTILTTQFTYITTIITTQST
jgi:predicted nucleic-acid-binding Zn-ribbon protein